MSSKSLNRVMLIGNLTRDPELRYTPSGTAVCTFSLATNRNWVDNNGQKQEDTQFHRLVAWGKLAEICAELLYKGRKIYVQGRLQTRSWQTNDGQDRQTTEVVVDEMIALGAPREGVASGGEYGKETPVSDSDEEVFNPDGELVGEPTKTNPKIKVKRKPSDKKAEKTKTEDINDDIPF